MLTRIFDYVINIFLVFMCSLRVVSLWGVRVYIRKTNRFDHFVVRAAADCCRFWQSYAFSVQMLFHWVRCHNRVVFVQRNYIRTRPSSVYTMAKEYDHLFKLLIIGDSGKSTALLTLQFSFNRNAPIKCFWTMCSRFISFTHRCR